uniref:Uncharacterized protein LOC100185346 n=1 Tax=Phallusia mammillata TaxID=59560 RepID=A0A6F9DHN8_9ASCI|nr:uncharacterized protein LOC100185346 [Phallusia mammillata]
MANSAPNLPGFYFDSEKNRYFKIQPGEDHRDNCPQKKAKVDVQNISTKLKPTGVKNICTVLHHRERTFQDCSVRNDVLLNRLLVLKRRKKLLKSHEWISNLPTVHDIAPSPDFSTCLCRMGSRLMHLPTDRRFSKPGNLPSVYILDCEKVLDISFTSFKVKPLQGICTCILAYNNSVVRLQPLRYASLKVDKFTSDVPFACAGNQTATSDVYNVSYSSGSKTLFVKSIERHFASSRPGKDFADIFDFSSVVRSQCFSTTSNLHFSGLGNGTTVAVDWRCKPQSGSKISMGRLKTGAVMALQVLNDGRQLIMRNIAEKDTISLWDVRMATKPTYDFLSIDVPRGPRRGHHRIYVYHDQILSSVAYDGIGRVWNVLDGKLIYELDQTNTNPLAKLKNLMYNDRYLMDDGAPAFFGFTCSSLGWLSLSSNLLPSMKNLEQ